MVPGKKNNKKRKPHRTVHHRMNFTVCKFKKNSCKFQEKLNTTLLRVGEAGKDHMQNYAYDHKSNRDSEKNKTRMDYSHAK